MSSTCATSIHICCSPFRWSVVQQASDSVPSSSSWPLRKPSPSSSTWPRRKRLTLSPSSSSWPLRKRLTLSRARPRGRCASVPELVHMAAAQASDSVPEHVIVAAAQAVPELVHMAAVQASDSVPELVLEAAAQASVRVLATLSPSSSTWPLCSSTWPLVTRCMIVSHRGSHARSPTAPRLTIQPPPAGCSGYTRGHVGVGSNARLPVCLWPIVRGVEALPNCSTNETSASTSSMYRVVRDAHEPVRARVQARRHVEEVPRLGREVRERGIIGRGHDVYPHGAVRVEELQAVQRVSEDEHREGRHAHPRGARDGKAGVQRACRNDADDGDRVADAATDDLPVGARIQRTESNSWRRSGRVAGKGAPNAREGTTRHTGWRNRRCCRYLRTMPR